MQKKGDILTYGIFSLLIGAVLFLMLSRIGLLFGDSSERNDEYIIKDTAVLLDQLHALPGNSIIHTNYPVYDKIIEISNERVSIYPDSGDILKGQYTYRTIGYADEKPLKLEQQDSFDIMKDTKIKVNGDFKITSQPCQKHLEKIHSIQLISGMNAQSLANSVHDLLSPIATLYAVKTSEQYTNAPLHVDLALVFSKQAVPEITIYAQYKNATVQGIACELSNALSQKNLKSRFLVEDPMFSERKYVNEHMIYVLLPQEMNDADIAKAVYNVMKEVVS